MAFHDLPSQVSLLFGVRFAAFWVVAGVPHPLSNFRKANTFADFAWLDLTLPYFALVAVLVAVLATHAFP